MSQRTFWEWKDDVGEGVSEGSPGGRTRGSLDWGDVSQEEGNRLAQAHQLHWQLECHLGIVDLVVTNNRRRMVTAKTDRERHRVRLHHMFLGCGAELTTAIARLAQGDDEAREQIKRYIRENREAIAFQPDEDEIAVEGEHFHLDKILEKVGDMLDAASEELLEDVAITWGRDGRGAKTIRFGSYDFDQRLIRVHPALDRSWVPRFFVEYIVYHELLHAICPPVEGEGRRRVHTREFDELEREFPRYEEAVEWESKNLRRILSREE